MDRFAPKEWGGTVLLDFFGKEKYRARVHARWPHGARWHATAAAAAHACSAWLASKRASKAMASAAMLARLPW